MKDARHIGLKIAPVWVCVIGCLVLVSCASLNGETDTESPDEVAAAKTITYANGTKIASPVSTNQIGNQMPSLDAQQIKNNHDNDKLSVGQLMAYADRCSPKAISSPPLGLDCSAVKLRIDRMLKSDDGVNNALIMLDRIGRNGTLQNLKNGQPGDALDNQAIAGGILDPVVPQPPAPADDKPLNFLNENGFNIKAGTFTPDQG